MEIDSSAVFDPANRELFRNPPAPLGYNNLNLPDIVQRDNEDTDEIKIDFQEWIELGIFDDEDVTVYDHFSINTDSDDDIIEVPVVPVIKNIESVVISDEDDDFPISVENIKKEKEEKTKDVKDKANKVKDVVSNDKIINDKVKNVKDDKVKNVKDDKVKNVRDDKVKRKEAKYVEKEQRISKKPQDKAAEKKSQHKEKTSEKTEKHRDKKTKVAHKKSKLSTDDDSEEDKSRRKEKKYLPSSSNGSEEEYKKYSASDDYEDYKNFKREYDYNDDDDYYSSDIKEEYPSVHGVYHCEICNLTLNSHVTFQSHMTGKRHKKNMDAKNVALAVAKSYVPTKPTSKCPVPPPGFKRVESSSPAKIQEVIDDKLDQLRISCPGLHKVLEIQSLSETSYYCILCDAPCSPNSIFPHLIGFKHQLNCLKYYDSKLFDDISYKQKYQIESLVNQKLREFEKKYGRGHLKVEKDVSVDGIYDSADFPSTSSMKDHTFQMPLISTRPADQPSTSKQGADFLEFYKTCSQPDPTKAGFYCRMCLSHSNSKAMWEAHIRGKRHLANLKKVPGTAPSKSRNVPAPPGTIPRLYSHLEYINEPIVGLNQIREIVRRDIDSVSYTCFLCGGISVCESEIIDHILLTKHREKYLEKIQYPDLETLRSCQMTDHSLGALIAEMCEHVERSEGRGEPEVYYAKNSLVKM